MENPFTAIEQRLSTIEAQNYEILLAIAKRSEDNNQAELLDSLPDRLRSRDIKKVFSISNVTVWQWTKKGLLMPQIINGRNYFSKKDVLKLLNEKAKK